jgi:LmbE family N-acetylglucosaminyl deacetylase
MRRVLIILISVIAISLIVIILHIVSLKKLVPVEDYPYDTYLVNEQNKTALVVVAHDDDATLFAGTTSKLAEEGWAVNFLCFYCYHWRPEETPVRKAEMRKVAGIQGLNSINLINLEIRNRLDTVEKPWMPIPYDQFAENFNIDSLFMFIKDAINKTNPGVIFILDNKIGLYGHPEHVAIGKIIEDLCRLNHDSMGFSVKKIYQGVQPPSQAEKMMGNTTTYTEGKRIYQCIGMPLPDVQINIYPYAKKKKSVLLAHASQHRNIKKLFPFYKYCPPLIYFKIFDKEYFKIIEL